MIHALMSGTRGENDRMRSQMRISCCSSAFSGHLHPRLSATHSYIFQVT
jgi:hypothetical protein